MSVTPFPNPHKVGFTWRQPESPSFDTKLYQLSTKNSLDMHSQPHFYLEKGFTLHTTATDTLIKLDGKVF